MVEISVVGLGVGAALLLLIVAVHYSRGTGWEPTPDISQEVLDRRAESLPETDFPEPMNRAIGGGTVATAAVTGEADAELDADETETAEESGPAAIPDDEAEYHDIEFVKEGETVELANNETILDQGEEQGWDLPYACREGQCLSCAGHVTDGPAEEYVTHDGQEMLSDDELDEGYVLTCVAYPKEDFSIETDEAP